MEKNYEMEHLEKYKPFPFVKNAECVNNDRVYGQIYLDEWVNLGKKDGGIIRISASLVNKQMLNMEYEAIESEPTPLFFYEFRGEMTYDGEAKSLEMMLRNIHDIQNIKNGKEPDNFYLIRIIDTETIGGNLENVIKEYGYKLAFEGEITFSASPVLSRKVIIVVEDRADDEACKKLSKIYSSWNKNIKSKCVYDEQIIISELGRLFDSRVKGCEVRIYNVGQANCCYCDLKTKKIFFDIGVTRSAEDIKTSTVHSAVKEISTLDVDAVILSHWDLDHILGVCCNQHCLKEKIWIVPDFEKMYSQPTASIKRLCNYLIKDGKSKLFMVDTSQENKKDKPFFESSNKAVTIYKGELRASHGVNKRNNGGLLLKLENNRNILLPGDCENQVILKVTGANQYDNVLVPHHGAVMSEPTFRGKKGKKNAAYISCGKITGNCKLDDKIVTKYKAKGFKYIRKTKNLTVRNKYCVNL